MRLEDGREGLDEWRASRESVRPMISALSSREYREDAGLTEAPLPKLLALVSDDRDILVGSDLSLLHTTSCSVRYLVSE